MKLRIPLYFVFSLLPLLIQGKVFNPNITSLHVPTDYLIVILPGEGERYYGDTKLGAAQFFSQPDRFYANVLAPNSALTYDFELHLTNTFNLWCHDLVTLKEVFDDLKRRYQMKAYFAYVSSPTFEATAQTGGTWVKVFKTCKNKKVTFWVYAKEI